MLLLGGELSNSAATCVADIDSVLPRMARAGLNTVLVPLQWDLTEPEEGHFDFSLLDETVREARRNGLKVVLLWFGAWKNSMSCYVPQWVKRDWKRFPRACGLSGRPLEMVTAFSPDLLSADSTALTRLFAHLRATDSREQTVVMVQVENEIGMLESARDHCALARQAYQALMPTEAMKVFGLKKRCTWQQALGTGEEADERFQAYWYARYVERLAHAVKQVYGLPLYVNAALNSRGRHPGQYPSAGPLAHLFSIWKKVASDIDLFSPDIYDTGFKSWASQYATADNPLFIPESRCCVNSGVRALYAFGAHEAVGFSPFAIDQSSPREVHEVSEAYGLIRQMSPLLLKYRGQERLHGVLFDQQDREQTFADAGISITCRHVFTLPWDSRATDGSVWREGGALILRLNAMEYIVAGSGVVVEFKSIADTAAQHTQLGEDGFALQGHFEGKQLSATHRNRGARIGLASVNEVEVGADGSLHRLRSLNGDQTHQGRHVRIGIDDYRILHVRLYTYE